MNLDIVKNDLKRNVGKCVQITVYGLRNKTTTYVGHIYNIYPNIFSIKTELGEKSFTYNDLITGEVKIKYLT